MSILKVFILVLAGYFNLATAPAVGSFARESVESEESKSQKIQHKINEHYDTLWNKKKKHRIHKQTLQFFENCPDLYEGAINYPLQIFSNCSAREAKELIFMMHSLCEADKDINSFSRATLLERVTKAESMKRAAAHQPLLKILNHFVAGHDHPLSLFYMFYEKFVEINPSHYEWMADQIIRFGVSELSLNKWSIDKGLDIIKAFKDLSSENQPLFSAFLEVNQVTDFQWAKRLAQVLSQK